MDAKKEKIEEEVVRKISKLEAKAKQSKEDMAKLKDEVIHHSSLLSIQQEESKRVEVGFRANLEKEVALKAATEMLQSAQDKVFKEKSKSMSKAIDLFKKSTAFEVEVVEVGLLLNSD